MKQFELKESDLVNFFWTVSPVPLSSKSSPAFNFISVIFINPVRNLWKMWRKAQSSNPISTKRRVRSSRLYTFLTPELRSTIPICWQNPSCGYKCNRSQLLSRISVMTGKLERSEFCKIIHLQDHTMRVCMTKIMISLIFLHPSEIIHVLLMCLKDRDMMVRISKLNFQTYSKGDQ